MSTTQPGCQHCTAQTADGISLCSRCQRTVQRALGNVRSYHADLFTIAPPPAGVRRHTESADPTGSAVSRISASDPVEDLAQRTRNTLTTWMRALIDDRPGVTWPADTVDAIALRLAQHLRSIATTEWAGAFAAEITKLELDLRRFIERNKERWYAGVCGRILDEAQPEEFCTRVLYADPERDRVICPICRTDWPVHERREILLKEARDVETNVATIARALSVLLDDEPSQARLQNRIQTWVKRGKIERRGHVDTDGQVRKTYRLGDVLDLLIDARPARGA